MAIQVTIDSITGQSPYDIYICQTGGTGCFYMTTISSVPYSFDIPAPYNTSDAYMLKIIDSIGCVITGEEPVVTCSFVTPTVTPTSTVTPTVTPTPTPTPSSYLSVFNFDLFESGSDVILSGTGAFDLTSLTYVLNTNLTGLVNPSGGRFIAGTNNVTSVSSDLYSGSTFSGPSNFGTSGQTNANFGSGDIVGIIKLPQQVICLPSGYISNTVLTTTSTFTGQTLSGIGATIGVYTYTWGSGINTCALILNVF